MFLKAIRKFKGYLDNLHQKYNFDSQKPVEVKEEKDEFPSVEDLEKLKNDKKLQEERELEERISKTVEWCVKNIKMLIKKKTFDASIEIAEFHRDGYEHRDFFLKKDAKKIIERVKKEIPYDTFYAYINHPLYPYNVFRSRESQCLNWNV